MLFVANGLTMAKSCTFVIWTFAIVYFRSRDVSMTGFVYHDDQRHVSKCMLTTKIAKTETCLNKFLAEPSFKLHSGSTLIADKR